MNTYRLLKRTINHGYNKKVSIDYVVQRKIFFFWVEWNTFSNMNDARNFLDNIKAKREVTMEVIE